MTSREQWLLLFIASPNGQYRTDQIRVMKGMFLLSQEVGGELRRLYTFEPYHYGPFNTAVYHDLDFLENAGLISSALASGSNRRLYDLTEKGRKVVAGFEGLDRAAVETVQAVKRHVTSLSFLDLLRDVYQRYPDYAVKSVARK